ncbi:MAG: hypothetical protein QXW80_02885 [Candidatus Micrarchaeia archaeon]
MSKDNCGNYDDLFHICMIYTIITTFIEIILGAYINQYLTIVLTLFNALFMYFQSETSEKYECRLICEKKECEKAKDL